MRRCKVIVNPVAGRGAGEQVIPSVKNRLEALGLEFDLCCTEAPGQAVRLAEQAATSGWDIVAAVGGDGTVNEVINGLARARLSGAGRAALGVISVGRGNDFGYGVGVPIELDSACLALAHGQLRRLDVGLVVGGDYPDGRYFGNGVGIGFDAMVGFEALKLKRLHGFPSYIVAALKTIFLYFRAPLLRIELADETLVLSSLMVSIMNGRRMGGGFMMAPQGLPDDGLFDLCIVEQVSRMGILKLIPKFIQGAQAAHSAVRTARLRLVTVSALQGSLPGHADGETLCVAGERLRIEILPGLLEVVVPAEGQKG
jgi:diacylglycerol kinase (ATP)